MALSSRKSPLAGMGIGQKIATIALAVLAVIALRSSTVSLNRSRWLVWAALCFVVGLSTATNNTWWYVSDYGIPFSSSFPAIGGVQVNYAAFIAARSAADIARPNCRNCASRSAARASASRRAFRQPKASTAKTASTATATISRMVDVPSIQKMKISEFDA